MTRQFRFPFAAVVLLLGFSIRPMVANGQEDQWPKPLMRDFIGINGHTVSFKPELYAPVCDLVRDYHPIDWDWGKETNAALQFPSAQNGVRWDSVYGSWQQQGFRTDACLMFDKVPPDSWNNRVEDASRYGEAFAKSFGPSAKTPLVEAVEIGNEPGKYDDAAYREIFENMAAGLRRGDPKLKIATCNVLNGESGDYHKSIDSLRGLEPLYDVLNIHSYAMLKPWPTWERSFPEDDRFPGFHHDIQRLIDWRNENAADKEVWLTEFGYDSSTQLPAAEGDFAKWQGNSDLEQAQWLVRSFFRFATMDLQRAYIYFFNDDDEPKLHASSGLTRKFVPKPSFYAVSHLSAMLGDYRFSRVVAQQPHESAVYEFVHGEDSNRRVWVAWSPTGEGRQSIVTLPLEGWRIESIEAMPISDAAAAAPSPEQVSETLQLPITESPLYLMLRK